MRRGHRENICHRLAAGGLAGDRHPVCRHADNVCALERSEPIGFGKPAVVADSHSDTANCGVKYRKAQVAGLEIQVLFVPEMNLAKRSDVAVWSDKHRTVEELGSVALADTGDEMQLVLRGYLAPGSRRSSVGNRLR